MLERFVLKYLVQLNSRRVKRIRAAQIHRSIDRSIHCSVAHSIGLSVARSIARSIDRSIAGSILDRSLDGSLHRPFDHSNARSPGTYAYGIPPNIQRPPATSSVVSFVLGLNRLKVVAVTTILVLHVGVIGLHVPRH